MEPFYRRILLKISGEALAGGKGYGIDTAIARTIASEIAGIHRRGVQIALVIGGGNFFRGITGLAEGIDRTAGDTVGMLATIMNAILFKEVLRTCGIDARVLSAISVEKAAEFYVSQRAIDHLEQGRIVIVAAGTGNPFFSTDTAAALRCAELRCDALLKATKVDGIYDSDPVKNPSAVKISRLTHAEALQKNIRVMDVTAFSLCMENDIPIVVFKLLEPGNLQKCIEGHHIGSIVTKGE